MEILINAVKVTSDMTIEYVANPKRAGFKAHARYANYMAATTVDEYMELTADEPKYARPDLRYDEEHGYLIIRDADGEQVNVKAE